MQAGILSAARDIKYTIGATRALDERRLAAKTVKHARAMVASATPETKGQAVASLRKAIRAARRISCKNKLQLMWIRHNKGATPITLKVDGVLACDRSRWLVAAEAFGRDRFGDVDNGCAEQQLTLEKLDGQARGYIIDGVFASRISLLDTLQGRARLKSNTAAGNNFFVCQFDRD